MIDQSNKVHHLQLKTTTCRCLLIVVVQRASGSSLEYGDFEKKYTCHHHTGNMWIYVGCTHIFGSQFPVILYACWCRYTRHSSDLCCQVARSLNSCSQTLFGYRLLNGTTCNLFCSSFFKSCMREASDIGMLILAISVALG